MNIFSKRLLCFVQAVIISMTMLAGLNLQIFAAASPITVGDYIVCKGYKWNGSNWVSFSTTANEYGIRVVDKTKSSYEDMPAEYSGGLVTYADYCFQGCTSLIESPKLSNNLDCAVGIFDGCTGITEFNSLEAFGTGGYRDKPGFAGCLNLNNAFRNCTNLKTLIGPITPICQQMDSMFYGCSSLETAPEVLTVFQKPNIPSMFSGCTKLRGLVKIPNMTLYQESSIFSKDIENDVYVWSPGSALSVTKEDINKVHPVKSAIWTPDLDVKSVSGNVMSPYDIADKWIITLNDDDTVSLLFDDPSYYAEYVRILNSDNIPVIENKQFKDFGILTPFNLYEVHIPTGFTSIGRNSSTSTYKSLQYLSSATVIEIPNTVTWINSDGLASCPEITSIKLPDSLESMPANLLYGCSKLQEINIPSSVKSIGNNAFDGCTVLANINIPDTVETIGNNALANCKALESVSIPGTIKTIPSNLFLNDEKLSNIVLSEGCEVLSDNSFQNITGLIHLELPQSIKTIGQYAFKGSALLESIKFGENLESIGQQSFSGTAVTELDLSTTKIAGAYTSMLKGSNITKVVVPKRITNLSANAFDGYITLTNLDLPNDLLEIGNYALRGCTGLTSLEIPDKVTTIGTGALSGCKVLTSLTIPKSVTNIGADAFKGLTCSVSVYDNTPAKAYCVANSVPYIILSEVAPTTVVINQKPTVSVAVGDTFQMNAVVYPSNATDKSVTWDSLNSDIATIDATGKLTAVAPGVADIMVSTSNGMTAQATVSVAPATASISVTPDSVSTLVGGNVQLSVTKTPSDSVSTVTYTSENTGIATVSNTGLVTGVRLGDTNIVVKSGTATISVPVSVTDSIPVTSIELSDIIIDKGTTLTLNPNVLPSDATDKSVIYSIEDSTVASLSDNNLTGVEVGTTSLTSTSVSTPSVSKTVQITVSEPQPLNLTLSAATSYTRSNVSISVETTGNVDRVILPNGNIVSAGSLSYMVSTNGVYQFTAYSDAKYVTKSIEVNCIDKTPPSLVVSSIFSDGATAYSINAVDSDSGVDYVLLPDGSHATDLPATYTRSDSGDTTFTSVDKAGNIASKVYTRQNITLSGASTTTFVAYEGIPTEWTNQDAKVTLASYNPIDGSAMTIDSDVIDGSTDTQTIKIAGSITTGEPKTTVVEVTTKASANGLINVQVMDGLGNSETVPITIEYIDKGMPVATHTASGGSIVVSATDSLSGIKSITNPDGELSSEYAYQYNGTYRFVIEDVAGNILYYDVSASDAIDPLTPITPPKSPDSGAVAQYTETILEGTVYPVSTLDVTIPSTINFIIDKDRKFIGSDYTIVNKSALPLTISIKGISPKDSTFTEVVPPAKFPDWAKLTKAQTRGNLALMLGGKPLGSPNQEIGVIPANDSKVFNLSGLYGKDWGDSPLQLKYNAVFSLQLG